jgi:hypothetical protein
MGKHGEPIMGLARAFSMNRIPIHFHHENDAVLNDDKIWFDPLIGGSPMYENRQGSERYTGGLEGAVEINFLLRPE